MGISSVTVGNYSTLTKGLQFTESFIGAVRKAHIESREEQGAYKADGPPTKPAPRKKRTRKRKRG